MTQIRANKIDIEYESCGSSDAPVILLVMGLGAQLTRWPKPFVDMLVGKGFRVIRFDNRDIGLSTKFDAAGIPNIPAIAIAKATGLPFSVPYTLEDMAADAVALLDALQIKRVHLVGASMGGMIGQLIAADYPQRVLSFTSIMSTTGNPALPPSSPAATMLLGTPAPNPRDQDAYVAHAIKAARIIGSPAYPATEAAIRERVLSEAARSYSPLGMLRQLAAVTANGDRRRKLKNIQAPTMVIHGADDPLVPMRGGEDTAANIDGAALKIIPGMGHDLPAALHTTIVDAIMTVVQRTAASSPA
jgi:pimeloyl-ACP methyl ester carboxylesterase